jgi:hypothetical protein
MRHLVSEQLPVLVLSWPQGAQDAQDGLLGPALLQQAAQLAVQDGALLARIAMLGGALLQPSERERGNPLDSCR